MLKYSNKIQEEDCLHTAERCRPLLDLLSGKKIFITGGTGFFGKNLIPCIQKINTIINEPIKVTILSRDALDFEKKFFSKKDENFNFFQQDITDPITIKNNFDYIINAAVPTEEELLHSDPKINRHIIVKGAENVIDFALENNSKILYISSGGIYGKLKEGFDSFQEDHFDSSRDPIKEEITYSAKAKIEAEKLHYQKNNCNFVIGRCFTFAGPYLPLDKKFAIGNFIRDVINEHDIHINSDGKAIRSYMYTADLITWLLFILIKGKSKEVYNIGASEPCNIKTLAEKIVRISNSKSKIITHGTNTNKENSIYLPCIQKAKQELGLTCFYDLETSIKRMTAWCKEVC